MSFKELRKLHHDISFTAVSLVHFIVLFREYIDENLRWHFNIDDLCGKIASTIKAIKRVKPFRIYLLYTASATQ